MARAQRSIGIKSDNMSHLFECHTLFFFPLNFYYQRLFNVCLTAGLTFGEAVAAVDVVGEVTCFLFFFFPIMHKGQTLAGELTGGGS